jgi:hypothetical protein
MNPGTHGRVRDLLMPVGYRGYFLLDGWKPIGEFDPALHQDRAQRDQRRHLPRDQWGYVNNFLFLPPGRTIED